ncbi:MAG: TauD/TfdA family dioxygenase [Bacteroidota bacterium]
MMNSVTIITGAHIGEIPPTPDSAYVDDDLTPVATKTLIDVAKAFGTPVSFAQEQNGRLIQNILPIKEFRDRQISTSSETELLLHTETAFHPYKPARILLMCLRSDPRAFTTYAAADAILPKLTDAEIEILSQPRFITSLDESFLSENQPDFELYVSILRNHEIYGWDITFDYSLMRGVDSEASLALESFKNAVMSSIKQVCLKEGDIMVIDNATAVHGRTPFTPRYDGMDRWVKRILVAKILPPRQHIDGHVITTRFGS